MPTTTNKAIVIFKENMSPVCFITQKNEEFDFDFSDDSSKDKLGALIKSILEERGGVLTLKVANQLDNGIIAHGTVGVYPSNEDYLNALADELTERGVIASLIATESIAVIKMLNEDSTIKIDQDKIMGS